MTRFLTLENIAGLLFVLGFYPLLKSIWTKQFKLPVVTWGTWIALDLIAAMGMYQRDALNWQIIAAMIGAALAIATALKYGSLTEWTEKDQRTVEGALIGLVLWAVYDNADLGIGISNLLLFLAAVQMLEDAWRNPGNHSKLAWWLYSFSCVVMLFAIDTWSFASATQPITFAVIDIGMLLFIYRKRIVSAFG